MYARNRVTKALNPYGQLHNKWGPPNDDPFTAEDGLKTIQPLPALTQQAAKAFESNWLSHNIGLSNPVSVQARTAKGKSALGWLTKKQLKTALEQHKLQMNDQFAKDFQMWLLGKSPIQKSNPAYVREREKQLGINPDHGPFISSQVADYIGSFIDKKNQFMKKYTLLRMGPNKAFSWTLNHYFLYYKYILRGLPYTEDMILSDFDQYFPDLNKPRPDKPLRPCGWKDAHLYDDDGPGPGHGTDGAKSHNNAIANILREMDEGGSAFGPVGGKRNEDEDGGDNGGVAKMQVEDDGMAFFDPNNPNANDEQFVEVGEGEVGYGYRDAWEITWGEEPYICNESIEIITHRQQNTIPEWNTYDMLNTVGVQVKTVKGKVNAQAIKTTMDENEQTVRMTSEELKKQQLERMRAEKREAEAAKATRELTAQLKKSEEFHKRQAELDEMKMSLLTKLTDAISKPKAKPMDVDAASNPPPPPPPAGGATPIIQHTTNVAAPIVTVDNREVAKQMEELKVLIGNLGQANLKVQQDTMALLQQANQNAATTQNTTQQIAAANKAAADTAAQSAQSAQAAQAAAMEKQTLVFTKMNRRLEQMNKVITDLQAAQSASPTSSPGESQAKIAALQQELQSLHEKYQRASAASDNFIKEAGAKAQQDIDRLQAQLNEATATHAKTKEELDKQTALVATSAQAIADLKAKYEALRIAAETNIKITATQFKFANQLKAIKVDALTPPSVTATETANLVSSYYEELNGHYTKMNTDLSEAAHTLGRDDLFATYTETIDTMTKQLKAAQETYKNAMDQAHADFKKEYADKIEEEVRLHAQGITEVSDEVRALAAVNYRRQLQTSYWHMHISPRVRFAEATLRSTRETLYTNYFNSMRRFGDTAAGLQSMAQQMQTGDAFLEEARLSTLNQSEQTMNLANEQSRQTMQNVFEERSKYLKAKRTQAEAEVRQKNQAEVFKAQQQQQQQQPDEEDRLMMQEVEARDKEGNTNTVQVAQFKARIDLMNDFLKKAEQMNNALEFTDYMFQHGIGGEHGTGAIDIQQTLTGLQALQVHLQNVLSTIPRDQQNSANRHYESLRRSVAMLNLQVPLISAMTDTTKQTKALADFVHIAHERITQLLSESRTASTAAANRKMTSIIVDTAKLKKDTREMLQKDKFFEQLNKRLKPIDYTQTIQDQASAFADKVKAREEQIVENARMAEQLRLERRQQREREEQAANTTTQQNFINVLGGENAFATKAVAQTYANEKAYMKGRSEQPIDYSKTPQPVVLNAPKDPEKIKDYVKNDLPATNAAFVEQVMKSERPPVKSQEQMIDDIVKNRKEIRTTDEGVELVRKAPIKRKK